MVKKAKKKSSEKDNESSKSLQKKSKLEGSEKKKFWDALKGIPKK